MKPHPLVVRMAFQSFLLTGAAAEFDLLDRRNELGRETVRLLRFWKVSGLNIEGRLTEALLITASKMTGKDPDDYRKQWVPPGEDDELPKEETP